MQRSAPICYKAGVRSRRLPRPRVAPLAILAVAIVASAADPVRVEKIEALEGDETVIKVTLSAPLPSPPHATLIPKDKDLPDRLAIDLPGATLKNKRSREAEVGWGGVKKMRLGSTDERSARLVLDLTEPMKYEVTADGPILNVTLRPAREAPAPDMPIELRTNEPTAK